MRNLKYILATVALVTLPSLTFDSCKKVLGPTEVEIEDSVRHYLPVVLGDEVRMVWVVKNVGKESLLITDIQPANGSIELKSIETGLIPPGGEERIFAIFHSEKNVGYAEHKIRIFGNIAPNGVKEMKFDIHIVRPSIDRTDYEEIYYDNETDIDRESFNRGVLNRAYYTDADSADYMDIEDVGSLRDYKTMREEFMAERGKSDSGNAKKNTGKKSNNATSSSTTTSGKGTFVRTGEGEDESSYVDVLQFGVQRTAIDNEDFVDEIVIWYNRHKGAKISLKGYADKETGNSRLNMQLSQKRINNVVESLIRKGVPRKDIVAKAYGDTAQPFAENEKNRCVLVEVHK